MTQEEFFLHVKTQFDLNKPFVVYKYALDNEVHALLQEDCMVHLSDSFDESGFVVEGFTSDSISFYYPLSHCEQMSFEFIMSNVDQEERNTYSTSQEPAEFLSYTNSINSIVSATSDIENALDKVVLARFLDVPIQVKNISALIEKLINKNYNSFCYCFYHPKIGFWMGATPEQLIEIVKGKYSIMSLAGTKLKTEKRPWTAKEVEEQKIVTEFIVDTMEPLSSSIATGNVLDKEAGHLLHQLCMIEGQLKSKKGIVESLISHLHPTPAVSGRPKKQAIDLIKTLEPFDREYYTGFIGEMNMSKGLKRMNYYSFFVNLRCMQLFDEYVRIYVGGGITSLSEADKEWMETEHKSWIMKKLLLDN